MKNKETLEEVAERYSANELSQLGFINGAKWQQQKMYSEEEVLNFTQTMLMQYKFGNTNIEQLDLLKETLEQFKK